MAMAATDSKQADERGELDVTVGIGEGAAQGFDAFARTDQALGAVEGGFERGAKRRELIGFARKLIEIGDAAAGLQHVGAFDFVGAHEHARGEAEHAAELARFFGHHAGDGEAGFADLHAVADVGRQQRQQDRARHKSRRAAAAPGAACSRPKGRGGDAHHAAQRIGGVDRAQGGELEGVALGAPCWRIRAPGWLRSRGALFSIGSAGQVSIGRGLVTSRSAPRKLAPCSLMARFRRSPRKPVVETLPTPMISASSSTRHSPLARSRRSNHRPSRRNLMRCATSLRMAGDQMQPALAARRQRVVVGDQDQRGVGGGVEFEQQFDDARAGVGVEVAGGFVGKQDLRVGGKGARDGDALLLAAGQLARRVGGARGEADAIKPVGGAFACASARAGQFQRQQDVFQRGERGQQLKRLEHEADAACAQTGAGVFVEIVEVLAEQK